MEKFREVTETHLVATDYQIRQLREIQPVTPLFNSISQNKTEHKDKIIAPISINLRDRIYNLTAKNLVNKLALYLAAIQFLILKYTAQEEFVLATGALNIETSDSLIFCRFNQQNLKSFKDLLKITRSHLQEGYRHQNYDLNGLIETFLARGGNLETIFDIAVIQEGFSRHSSLLNKFQLVFEIEATDSSVSVTFSPDTFRKDFVQRMLGHFLQILEIVTINPDVELREIDILTPGEREQLLIKWNNTQTEYPADKCIHQLFEEQAKRTPNAIAVVYENESLTYQELNNRGNQLAHNLQKLGVKPDTLVGLCVKRSLEMIIGILGILKAGGAYVPLDPEYPQERLIFILEDSQVKLILTQEKLVESIPQHQASIICLDTEWEKITQEKTSNPESGAKPDNLTYIIYTSGSTGQPKGVLVNHSHVVRLFAATDPWYHFNSQDVWTLFHSYAFDFSVWEIWGALLYGGRLVIVPYLISRSPELFWELLCQEKVTILNQTPTAFRSLIQVEKAPPNPPCTGGLGGRGTEDDLKLRLVIFGGEALEINGLQPWFERYGDQHPQLVNMYGITETTVHVTYRPLSMADLGSTASVIGRPIPDNQVYILDQYLQPVPLGVTGQMYVGGAGVTRGYLNRRELTEERFIPSPFSPSKLYKTGDLARYLSKGELEYLGRIDNQVKIRGFRIELGEIEALLAQYSAIWESVVVVREDTPGDKCLVGYVVPQRSITLTIEEIRQFLKAKLPEYMIPNTFVILEALPLNSNSKVDRRALPSPEQIHRSLADNFVAPCTPIEEILALIWAEVLGIEQVGIHDNFFELGGDSIRGIQVIAKARKMSFNLSLSQLLQHQTIQELASLVSQELNPLPTQNTEKFSLISENQPLNFPPDIEDAYPLTALQLGMIFHSEYQGNVPVYHDVFTYHIRTVFNYTVLHQTIQEIAARHGILRTSFALTDYAEPLQLVHHQVEIPLALADLSSLTSLEQEAALDDWIEREKSHPFDWQVPPLLRFHIHLRSTETFNLTLSFHHSILDGWSVASLLTELLQQYLYRLGQNILPLAAPPTINFRDFVALEQTILKSQPCQEYWQKQLEDLTITPLPEWPEVSQKNKNWDWLVPIPTEVSQSLKRLGKKAGVPLKSVLLSAHLRVLSLLNNQTDVLTGLVSNGRLEETDGERVLGLFLNTLPLRLQLTGGTWLDLVRQVFATERDSLAWRRYPLAELQKRLGGQPLFDTAFNFVHFHIYQAIIGVQDLEVLGGKFFNQTNFTLLTNFSLHPLSGEVELTLKYDGDRLGQAQMERMAGYYQKVLTAIAQNPSQSFQDLCLLSDEEQAQILWDWNRTQTDLPPQQCVHQLFEIQVERSPDAVAIVWNQERLTYRQLNEQANQVAHYLQNLGVESESLVGICLERSLSLVVGLLGILKAGGAYVPLDPHYPTERLELILTDSQVPVLLTQQTLLSHLSHYSGDRVVLDRDAAIIAQQPKTNPKSQVSSSNSVYVIYTSGSTGKPKGVVIEHRSTVTLLDWARTVFSFDELAGVLASTSVCFDLSVFELFLPLTVGGAVILADNALALPNLAAATEVTLINTVPTAIAQLLALEAIPQSVRTVNLAGEPLSNSLVQKLYQLPQIERVYNLYGPSEDTTYSTFSCIEKGATTQPSIGRPIAHSQVYLLNATHQPVPLGTIGELYMGGAGLARGYLHRPELTAEKFIANPFHSPLQKHQGLSPSPKLYKTGDLARYRPDGNLEFLGRSDYQIKLRGFRIELGEIEVVLENCPGVKQAVVLRREDLVGGAKLVAYVVSENSTLTTQDLRRFLEQQLPDYMIPGFFVPLESFPLTPNGKVNRPALPRPEMELIPNGDFAAPQTAQEQILATIWQNVLGIQQVGRGDRFFELGGDSILSLQVVAQARQAGLKITPRQIFRYPSLAELAACCDIDSIGDTPNFSRTLTHQGLVTGEVPLTPIQKWFFEQNRSDSHHFNQSVLLNVPAQTQPTLLSQALSHLLQHHDALRLRFNLKQGQWQQDHGEITETVPLAVIDLSSIAPDQQFQRLEAIATEQQASFNLAEGKLMRVVLFQLGGQQGNRLLIIHHHLVVDGVSWRVLLEDLWTAYQQLENQKTVQLPPKTLAFRDWALLLTTSAQEQTLQKELSYWLNQPWSTVMPLPVIQPPEKRSHPVAEVAEITVTLNVEKTRALLQQVPSVFNTQINDVLLTALAQTLTAWTGSSTILLDLEGHGREEGLAEVDVSRTVGWFTSLFPVILQLPDSNHPGESLKSIKEQLRMIPNHGIGYGILRYLSPDANVRTQMAALPKRDIIFNYLGQFDGGQSQATPWQLAPESKGANHGSADAPSHWLEINARVIGGQLEIIWSYARHIHDKATVVGLADNYLSALLKLIDYCLSPVVGGFTPSDFPVANLNQQELDEILAELD
ncbi:MULTISPECIES: non-ribosomal peptide synthetase [Planktothrix]|uniref:Non ribosomal peptide synthetase, involved in microcystin biosynthesis n=10 Tax=Planktothrix TaxID=54304 RepID=A0A6J7ZLD8_PLARU|nr:MULTISPECIES: non-ribosomal peptide synthetase [Planktothrix]CAC5343231.1 non ribosomal peptide synthetase, involved in microcystin biosynthesis [Planktothrix rubescens NIVA-CYA 18]CAD5977913.1 Linear gramicidin synthase subunit B [Planktothrix rubescens NIVA-CYA 18]CAQ48245.1 McyA protein [Planktothrix prolifica NIVA-CYA 98]